MNKKDVQNAFDSCLTDLTFTNAHRKAVLQGIKKSKRKAPFRLQGIVAASVLAATLIVIVGVRSAHHDDDIYASQGGDGQKLAAFTTIPTDEIVPLELMTEEEAIAISKDALVEKEKLERIVVDAFSFIGVEGDEAWLISVTRGETLIYEVTVNKQTAEATILSKVPIMAQEEEELSEGELAMQALLAYESEITRLKGDMLYWSLEEKAHRSELAKAAGVQGSKWDTMPTAGAISMEEAIAIARGALKGKATTDADAKEVDTYNAYASFLQDSKGATIWYIQFESKDGKQLLPVEVKPNAGLRTKEQSVIELETAQDEVLITYYYNPNGGLKYHFDPNCSSVSSRYLPLSSADDEAILRNLVPCSVCVHVR